MHRNQSVDVHQFSMIPRAEIPRSAFRMQKALKTCFDAGYLIPIMVEEVLPGDTFNVRMTAFARMATPIFPVMDNLHFESFFFFVPCRLVWNNWVKFMGEQISPGDSISYTIPQVFTPVGGCAISQLGDYMGLPTIGQVLPGNSVSVNALPFRSYYLIWNQWFRDENLQPSVAVHETDGPDPTALYVLLKRGKRHDYFTSCLPWPQKGGTAVSLPLGTSAPVRTQVANVVSGAQQPVSWLNSTGAVPPNNRAVLAAGQLNTSATAEVGTGSGVYPANMYADLSAATAATINQLRQAFQIQKVLERDARGGTRYTEIVSSHFGVRSPDARLQRPEYLGGGHSPIMVNPIAQTSASNIEGGTSPQGNLAAMGTMTAHGHGFTQSFTEHGYIIGMCSVRADLTYQQGLRKLWSRRTRFDFYLPAFAALGEQAVLTKEIYCDGSANDEIVFGYQERWAEYRYNPSQITSFMRSTAVGTIDAWHYAQRFVGAPVLGPTFIEETPPVGRALAVGAAANGMQFLFDGFFDMKVARPMPTYSVPGLIDHF